MFSERVIAEVKFKFMHIADQSNGNLGANAVVGGSMGIARICTQSKVER